MATHNRQTSLHSKKAPLAHARPSKPAPSFRRTSSHGASKKTAPKHDDAHHVDDEDLMATSFLQFW